MASGMCLQLRHVIDTTLPRALCMKHISVYLFFALAVQSLCRADVTKLAPEDRRVLENASRFQEVHSTGDLPSAVVAICSGGKIADPGQK
jgi:hypothetical protein